MLTEVFSPIAVWTYIFEQFINTVSLVSGKRVHSLTPKTNDWFSWASQFSTDENFSSLNLSDKLPGHLKINWAHFNLIPNAQLPGELFSAPFVAVCNYHASFKEKKSNKTVFYVNYHWSFRVTHI